MNVRALIGRLPLRYDWFWQIQAEWQSNARLRRGLLAVWGLLLLYFCLVLSDMAAEQRQALEQVQSRLERLLAIDAQQFWLQRELESKAALSELESSFPQVSSSGRADAEVRSMLEQMIQAPATRRLRLSMIPAEPVNDGKLWRVVGTIMGVVDGKAARDLVAELETKVNYARFRRLRLVRGLTPEKVRVEVEVEAFFRATDT